MPAKKKCEELTGTLREDCLKQERGADAGVGSTVGTDTRVRELPPSPPVTTPPQNPR